MGYDMNSQAFFSNIRFEILSLLEHAEKEVLIAMAWFTSAELFDALISCLKRNVKVELVLLDNAINYMYYAPDFNELIIFSDLSKLLIFANLY